MSDPDDELKQISDQASAEANFIPESPLEEMLAGLLGVQHVLDARETAKQEKLLKNKSQKSKRFMDFIGKMIGIYAVVGILAILTRLAWIWLT